MISCEFRHAAPSEFVDITNHASLMAERNADGTLPYSTFASLRQGSSLIDRGTCVDATIYRGIEVAGIDYKGNAPDLGAIESEYTSTTLSHPFADSPSRRIVKIINTRGGITIVRLDNGVSYSIDGTRK